MDSKCPACGHVQRVPREYAGTQIKCRMCKKPFAAAPYYPPPPPEPPPPWPLPLPPTEPALPSPTFFRTIGRVCLFIVSAGSFATLALLASVGDPLSFLLSALIVAGAFLGSAIVCCIPLGIAAIIDAINANTLAREKSENSEK